MRLIGDSSCAISQLPYCTWTRSVLFLSCTPAWAQRRLDCLKTRVFWARWGPKARWRYLWGHVGCMGSTGHACWHIKNRQRRRSWRWSRLTGCGNSQRRCCWTGFLSRALWEGLLARETRFRAHFFKDKLTLARVVSWYFEASNLHLDFNWVGLVGWQYVAFTRLVKASSLAATTVAATPTAATSVVAASEARPGMNLWTLAADTA